MGAADCTDRPPDQTVAVTGTIVDIGVDDWSGARDTAIVAIVLDELGAIHFRTRGLLIAREGLPAWPVTEGQRITLTLCEAQP